MCLRLGLKRSRGKIYFRGQLKELNSPEPRSGEVAEHELQTLSSRVVSLVGTWDPHRRRRQEGQVDRRRLWLECFAPEHDDPSERSSLQTSRHPFRGSPGIKCMEMQRGPRLREEGGGDRRVYLCHPRSHAHKRRSKAGKEDGWTTQTAAAIVAARVTHILIIIINPGVSRRFFSATIRMTFWEILLLIST